MLDLHLMLKRGKIAGKAFSKLMFHHSATFSCRSDDVNLTFISPRDYEFSCRSSPAYPSYFPFHVTKRRNQKALTSEEEALQKVVEILNSEAEASPLNLPGFGRSPCVRQLRVTDSPFPLKETEEDDMQVDLAAEEFIKKFYKELRMQKLMSAVQSPNHDTWAR